MKNLRQNGHAVMTLSDLIDDFCLAQGNMRQAMILAQYRHARWAWKDLFRTTLWTIRKAVLCVDCEKHTVKLPDDCERLLTVSVVDCRGKLHPLGFNTDFNTAKITCVKPACSCNNCSGEDTLCGAIDTISTVTNTIIIHDVAYTQTILTRYDGSGAVQIQTTTPAWSEATSTVVYNVNIETICNVETTDKGCIKATQPNMDLLREHCGCGNFLNEWNGLGRSWGSAYREIIPSSYNYWGEWNFNAADSQIIDIFHGTGNHFGHTNAQEAQWRGNIRQVIIDYQTNGETPETEILVPEYAVNAVQTGIIYQQKAFNPRVAESDKVAAKYAYRDAKMSVAKYLNPIFLEEIRKLQTHPRTW